MLLDENEEVGRIVVFAGFTGSVDRIVKLCLKEKWDVVRCDQGNFQVFTAKSDSLEGVLATGRAAGLLGQPGGHGKVAFVANPESGGMSLTLVEARMAVYWSNSWKPEYRVQSRRSHPPQGHGREPGMHYRGPDPSAQRRPRVGRDPRQPEAGANDDGRSPPGVDWKDAGRNEVVEAVRERSVHIAGRTLERADAASFEGWACRNVMAST